ncbi:MAG: hypothetical protein IKB60_01795 [Clostridia bacterium]|nr:hypothetical protein [Clostridia bacterium]
MIINHNETKEIINKALEKCQGIIAESLKFFEDSEKIRADKDLVPDAKDRKILEVENAAKEKAKNICSELTELVEGFEKVEKENSLCFDVSDAKVLGVTEIMNSMGSDADAELCASVVETFKGQYLALKYLKSIFKKNGLSTEKIDSVIVNIDEVCEELRDLINDVHNEGIKSAANAFKLKHKLIDIADNLNLGIKFSEEEKNLGADYEQYLDSVRFPSGMNDSEE